MITEPEAAAAHYAAARHLADGDTVAVYDLGGGTFDATVLRKRARRHRHPRQPRGHRAARRRRLRRRDPRPHQLQLRRRAERARPEQPADRHRPGPAAAGLHRGEGGALDRHRGVHPGVPAEPALRRPPHARRVRRHDPRPDRVDDRRADPHAAFRARRAHRPQRGAAGRGLLPDPARRADDHGGAQPAHAGRRAPQVRRRARRGHGRCRARRAGRAGGRRRPGVGSARAHGGAGRVRTVRTASRGRTAAPGRAGRRGPRRRARPGRRLRGRLDRWPRARGRVRDVTVRVRRHAGRARAARDREPSRRAAVPRPPAAPVQRRGAGERQRRMVPARDRSRRPPASPDRRAAAATPAASDRGLVAGVAR